MRGSKEAEEKQNSRESKNRRRPATGNYSGEHAGGEGWLLILGEYKSEENGNGNGDGNRRV